MKKQTKKPTNATPPTPPSSTESSPPTPSSPLAVVAGAGLKPPLTKSEQIKATAAAVYAQRMAAYREFHQRGQKLRDAVAAKMNAYLAEHLGKAKHSQVIRLEWEVPVCRVEAEIHIPAHIVNEDPDFIALRQWQNEENANGLPHLDSIEKELRAKLSAAAHQTDRIKALLDNPDIAKQLATAGEKILTQFTPDPKAIAA